MDMQNVSNLTIPEGEVKAIHDSNNQLLWGRVSYNTKYAGDTFQRTYIGIQLCPNTEFETLDGWTATSYWSAGGDNTLYLNIPATTGTNTFQKIYRQLPTISSHKYYVSAIVTQPNGSSSSQFFLSNSPTTNYPSPRIGIGIGVLTDEKYSGILQPESDNANIGVMIQSQNKTVPVTAIIKDFFCVDLTAKYGAGNEPTKEWCDENLSWEPYVGSTATQITPAPNPDYPQDIQVVTGEQTVTISDGVNSEDYKINLTSKNLAYDGWVENFLTRVNNTNLATTETFDNRSCLKFYASVSHGDYDNKYIFKTDFAENTQYTFSFDLYVTNANGFTNMAVDYTDGTTAEIPRITQNTWTSVVFTTASGKTVKYLRANWRSDYSYIDLNTFQVEKNSQATPYTPYYNYELAKIGNYRDYIYNSSNDWYVHKEIEKVVLDGSDDEGWTVSSYNRMRTSSAFGLLNNGSGYGYYANQLINANSETMENSFNVGSAAIYIKCTGKTSSVANWKTWLSSNNLIIYASLVTPTDTQITDATLIGQLNVVHEWLTRYGYNATVSGNLPLIVDRTNL